MGLGCAETPQGRCWMEPTSNKACRYFLRVAHWWSLVIFMKLESNLGWGGSSWGYWSWFYRSWWWSPLVNFVSCSRKRCHIVEWKAVTEANKSSPTILLTIQDLIKYTWWGWLRSQRLTTRANLKELSPRLMGCGEARGSPMVLKFEWALESLGDLVETDDGSHA